MRLLDPQGDIILLQVAFCIGINIDDHIDQRNVSHVRTCRTSSATPTMVWCEFR